MIGTEGNAPEHSAISGGQLRTALLLLVILGTLGLIADLVLLEHTEGFSEWLPLAVLSVGLLGSIVVAARPSRSALRVFQVLMLAFLVVGGLGLVLHFRSNIEFELEMYPSMKGVELIWESLKGAVPALAPAALAQLGLLGLVFTYRHPSLRS